MQINSDHQMKIAGWAKSTAFVKLGTILLQCQQIKRCLKTSTAFISVHIKLSHIPINVGNVHVNIQIKNKRQGPTILFIKFHRRVADTGIYYVLWSCNF